MAAVVGGDKTLKKLYTKNIITQHYTHAYNKVMVTIKNISASVVVQSVGEEREREV